MEFSLESLKPWIARICPSFCESLICVSLIPHLCVPYFVCPAICVSLILCVPCFLCPSFCVSFVFCGLTFLCPSICMHLVLCVPQFVCPSFWVSLVLNGSVVIGWLYWFLFFLAQVCATWQPCYSPWRTCRGRRARWPGTRGRRMQWGWESRCLALLDQLKQKFINYFYNA